MQYFQNKINISQYLFIFHFFGLYLHYSKQVETDKFDLREINQMGRKEEYKFKNEQFFASLRTKEEIQELPGGVLYRIINNGDDKGQVRDNSVVTVHYKGSLINGRVFDNSRERNCPEAFRVNGLIDGFRIALLNMHIGDRWEVYIPYDLGYGKRSNGEIPGFSTLIFDIELINIA